MKVAIGSANHLAVDPLASLPREILDALDPRLVSQKLALQETSDRLFPFVLTGVTVWPFLLVADTIGDWNERRITARLRQISRRSQRMAEHGDRQVGPSCYNTTFVAYARMVRRIRGDSTAIPLQRLLDDRRYRSFDGNIEWAKRHDAAWRRAFTKSLPDAGKSFVRICRIVRRKALRQSGEQPSAWQVVNGVVDVILRHHTGEPHLWCAAFCYAFLRAVYGYVEKDAQDGSHIALNSAQEINESVRRARWMLSGLTGKNGTSYQRFREFMPLLRTACKKGAFLSNRHVKAKKESARFLTGMRFFTAYRLLFESIPKTWRKE